MNYITHAIEHQILVNLTTNKLFYVEGVYESEDHLTAVMVDDNERSILVNWTTNSSDYKIYGK